MRIKFVVFSEDKLLKPWWKRPWRIYLKNDAFSHFACLYSNGWFEFGDYYGVLFKYIKRLGVA